MKKQDEAEKGESIIDGMHILVKVHVPGIMLRDILFPHPMIQIEDGDNRQEGEDRGQCGRNQQTLDGGIM